MASHRVFRLVALVGTVLLGVASGRAAKDTFDGNYLLQICNTAIRFSEKQYLNEVELQETGWCHGFLQGFSAGHYMTMDWLEGEKVKTPAKLMYCVPKEAQAIQVVRVVVKYLKEHPQYLHWGMGILTELALRSAFPCPK